MINNGLWTGVSTIQKSGFVLSTAYWDCDGNEYKSPNCPSNVAQDNETSSPRGK